MRYYTFPVSICFWKYKMRWCLDSIFVILMLRCRLLIYSMPMFAGNFPKSWKDLQSSASLLREVRPLTNSGPFTVEAFSIPQVHFSKKMVTQNLSHQFSKISTTIFQKEKKNKKISTTTSRFSHPFLEAPSFKQIGPRVTNKPPQ